jgi:hypothetical protein
MTADTPIPYGGALRTCPTCDGTDSKPEHLVPDGGQIHPCPDCVGGWIDVDTTMDHLWGATDYTGRFQCAYCNHEGDWLEDVGHCPLRPAQWAYPQPGDWVLVEDGFSMRIAYVHMDPNQPIAVLDDSGLPFGWKQLDDLRLIVDRPNPSRIPGTEPPA